MSASAGEHNSGKPEASEVEENIGDHSHHAVIEKSDLQGDLDIGAQALDGQSLDFTEKGNKHQTGQSSSR